ncbi:MAG: Phosphonate ABC transporter, periplasmic phosphonate-binding protein [Cenarchaeum symbiont of Oopsacas minuta]|nr:Phosphonate ABC transporter, periplasmic phosphonate-binding protein [Cenarchaeum symbiont of Oopsacas minuta]
MKTAFICILAGLFISMMPIFVADAQEQTIPEWIKESMEYWVQGDTTDREFLDAITYLLDMGIIMVEPQPEIDELTIGFIPIEKAQSVSAQASAFESYLETKMAGVDIMITIPTDYETIIEGMRFGHIDAAFMDTGPAWIAHERTGAEVILAEVINGKINYQATVWALADDDSIQEISDLVGKRVAFTSITGSSGFIRPMGTLVTEGYVEIKGNDIISLEKTLDESFESHTFAGGYKGALTLLLNKNVDVAFGSDIAPQKYLKPQEQSKLRAVTTLGPVPSHVFVTSPNLPDSTIKSLTDALVDLNGMENNHILQDLYGAEALLPTTTEMHIGEFGTFINVLTGLDQLILDKYNKSK